MSQRRRGNSSATEEKDMRRVKKNLCRNNKGKFTRCRGRSSSKSSGGLSGARRCKHGVNKRTGRCLKRKRRK
jgi:hypothetical protein